ncbi:MAG: hypothetical protein ABFR97_10500 [Thermodesulfobacteriota bacterium]
MTEKGQSNKGMGVFAGITFAIGGLIGVWALATMVAGLRSVGWDAVEMGRQFLIATNNLHEYETLVDYYTHIKGVEYLIAASFFVAFTYFFKYVDKGAKQEAKALK